MKNLAVRTVAVSLLLAGCVQDSPRLVTNSDDRPPRAAPAQAGAAFEPHKETAGPSGAMPRVIDPPMPLELNRAGHASLSIELNSKAGVVKKDDDGHEPSGYAPGKAEWVHSLAEIVIEDPRQRRTGYDPLSDISHHEIPGGSYSLMGHWNRESGQVGSYILKRLALSQPLPGEYRLAVYSNGTGTYDLEVRARDSEGNPSNAYLKSIPITAGQVHAYRVNLDEAVGSKVAVTRTDRAGD